MELLLFENSARQLVNSAVPDNHAYEVLIRTLRTHWMEIDEISPGSAQAVRLDGPCLAIQIAAASMFLSVAYDDPQLQVEYSSPKNAFGREAAKGWLYLFPCCPCGGFEGSVVKLSILFDEFFPPPGGDNHHP